MFKRLLIKIKLLFIFSDTKPTPEMIQQHMAVMKETNLTVQKLTDALKKFEENPKRAITPSGLSQILKYSEAGKDK